MADLLKPRSVFRSKRRSRRMSGSEAKRSLAVLPRRKTERRLASPLHAENSSRPLLIGIFVMVFALLLMAFLFVVAPDVSATTINVLLGMLALGTVALAWVFALSCAVRRAVFRDARAAFLGVGIVLVGGLVPTTQMLALPLLRQQLVMPTNIEALGTAGHLVGYLLLAVLTITPELATAIKGWTVIVGSAVAVALLWLPLDMLPSVVQHVSVLAPSPVAFSHNVAPALVIGVAWLTLGIVQIVGGIRGRGSLNLWLGNTMLAWAMSYLFIPLWGMSITWAAVTGAFELLAMLFAIAGIDFELEVSFQGVMQELRDSLVSTRLLSANREIEIGFSRKRMHDIHNILFSVEGATSLLQKQASLTTSQRKVVSNMLTSQLAYLQELIETPLLAVASTLESVWTGAQTGIDVMKYQIPGCTPSELCDKKLAGSTEDNFRAIRLVLNHMIQLSDKGSLSVEFHDEGSHISITISVPPSEAKNDTRPDLGDDLLELYASDLLLRRTGGKVTLRTTPERNEVQILLPVFTDSTPDTRSERSENPVGNDLATYPHSEHRDAAVEESNELEAQPIHKFSKRRIPASKDRSHSFRAV